jgi:hypothetical protein
MMSLLVFVYFFKKPHHRRLAAVGVLTLAGLMALSRMFVGAHWLSDTLGSILLVGLCCDLLYRYILRVPEQMRWLEAGHSYPSSLTYWELKLLPRLVFGLLIPLLPVLVWSQYHQLVWVLASGGVSVLLFLFFIKDLGNYQLRQLQKLRGSTAS